MSTEFDMAKWDELIETAGPSKCVAFDPDAPGGFRALTPKEDRALIDAVRRHEEPEHEERER